MPVNTIQIQKLLGKHTFQQLRITVNELIDVVNGLPSTVRGDITRQGGVIDGQATGVLPLFDPGNLLITGSGGMGIGNFLGTDDPDRTGQLHINRAVGDARLNLSQNTATGITYISLQASNTASDPQANNFGFLAATSNTTSQYGMVVLSTANTDQEVSHIFARESWGWGNTADVDSSTRLTLTSGENVGLAPHGGPTAHLAAQLRVDRALANDAQTTNTAPIISARGYSASHGGLGNNQVPVRITIGDRNDSEGTTANTYAALDFLADGADTTTEDSIGARIGAEYTREQRRSSALEFSVRNGAAVGTLEKVMKILPGSEGITGHDSKGAVMISNTYYLDAATGRSLNMGGVSEYANAQYGQLIVQQTKQGGFVGQGVLIRGNDDDGQAASTGMARLAMENPIAEYDAGRKWDMRVESTSSTQARFEIASYPDNDWTGTGNTQFLIAITDDGTLFNFGNRTGESSGGGSAGGATLSIDGGYGVTSGGTIGEGAQINIDTNRAYQQEDPNRRPTTWAIDNKLASLRIFPRNLNGFSDTTGSTVTSNDSAVWFTKSDSSNTMIGLGVQPSHTLHIKRNWESANVVIESAFGSSSPRNQSTAEIRVQDQLDSAGRAVILKAINPDNTYDVSSDSAVSIYAAQRSTSSTQDNAEMMRLVYRGADQDAGKGLSTNIRFSIRNDSGGSADNDGTAYGSSQLKSTMGIGTPSHAPFGVSVADRSDYGSFQIWNAKNRTQTKNFHLTSYGNLALGRGNDVNINFDPVALTYPSYNLDLVGLTPTIGQTLNYGNTYVAFTIDRGDTTNESSWLMGVDAGGLTKVFSGVGDTDDPFVIRSVSSRTLGNPRGTTNNLNNERDGLLSIQKRSDQNATQIYQIGVREETNTLTIYTAANTSSPNWAAGVAEGRVGIGNTVPAHTLTVAGDTADRNGIAVYGAQAGLRFIDPEPTHPVVASGLDNSRNLNEVDPGALGTIGVDYPAERTYHIGSRNGSLVVAQQLGPNDTDIHDSAKAATLSVTANTKLISPSAGAIAQGRIWSPEGIGGDHFSSGSVGINANNVPLASGLFVGDYSKAAEDRRFVFTERAYFAESASERFVSVNGVYPTLSVLSGRPLSQANGAFKTVSVTAAITSNNAEASSPNAAGTGNIIKRIQGVRRFSEGAISGVTADNLKSDWRTVAWHDGIGVDDNFSVPMPAIGSEWMGTNPSDSTGGLPDHDIDSEATRVWWERRAHHSDFGADYQNQEYTESHLFGSSNNHVMTIHANTSYQGVHVEKGGIYANNSILAWARILPRGTGQNQLVTTDTLENDSIPYAAVCNEFHNIDGFTHVTRGLYQLELPAAFQNQNNYSVMVTGTNNLYISSSPTSSGDLSGDITGGFANTEYRDHTYRKAQAEIEHLEGDVRGAIASTNANIISGGFHQYSVRVANSTVIQVESRTGVRWSNDEAHIRHDDDEVYVVVVGAPDVTKFRG